MCEMSFSLSPYSRVTSHQLFGHYDDTGLNKQLKKWTFTTHTYCWNMTYGMLEFNVEHYKHFNRIEYCSAFLGSVRKKTCNKWSPWNTHRMIWLVESVNCCRQLTLLYTEYIFFHYPLFLFQSWPYCCCDPLKCLVYQLIISIHALCFMT